MMELFCFLNFFLCSQAVYVGSVPIDVTTGVDILKAAATILMGKSENIKKVWMSMSDKTISILVRGCIAIYDHTFFSFLLWISVRMKYCSGFRACYVWAFVRVRACLCVCVWVYLWDIVLQRSNS